MTTELKVPALPESVSDGVLVCWHKQPGDAIRRDEPLVDIETDKVVLEVPAPQDGVLEKILVVDGSTVVADQVIGVISASGSLSQVADNTEEAVVELQAAVGDDTVPAPGPAARRLLAEHDIDPRHLSGSGRSGRITKADVLAGITQVQAAAQPVAAPPAPEPAARAVPPPPAPQGRCTTGPVTARIRGRTPAAACTHVTSACARCGTPAAGDANHGHADHVQRGQHATRQGAA